MGDSSWSSCVNEAARACTKLALFHTLLSMEMTREEENGFLDDVSVQEAYTAALNEFLRGVAVSPVVMGGGPDDVPGLRFDAWVPDVRFGADLHDLSGGRPEIFERGALRDKLVRSRAAGIKHVQFFSDEWTNRGGIVRSMLSNGLGVSAIKLNGRDCTVRRVMNNETKTFFEGTHVSGSTRASKHVLLEHPEHGPVAGLSIRTPIQKKHGHVCELARVAFKGGCSVRGGASKMIEEAKKIALEDGFDGVLSYADLRHGDGGVYVKCGFEQVGESVVSYGYTNGVRRFDRFKYRAQPGKPERQVAEENNVRPVWACGNRIFLMKLV